MSAESSRIERVPGWAMAGAPFLLVALLAALLLVLNPVGGLRAVPPVEELAVEHTELHPGTIELVVRNDGPDPVTVAQVLVGEAYWDFEATDRTLGRLQSATFTINYPWEEGLPLNISFVTSTGLTIPHDIEAAAETPEADASTFAVYSLLGLYIGVIPVVIGLLWFPALRRASRKWIAFFLAFTVGLLVFLLIDATGEGLELAGETGAALGGLELFAIGALVAVSVLLLIESLLARRRSEGVDSALALAYLVAAGIGIHNLGEGLAVGAALAAGEIALGTFLVLGFALHNTTEGLAIVAPLGGNDERPSLWHFAALGAVAGAPTIVGAWIGGFAFTPAWGTAAFGLAAGAIAQVVWTIGRGMRSDSKSRPGMVAAGFLAGLVVMYGTALFTA